MNRITHFELASDDLELLSCQHFCTNVKLW